MKPKLFDDKTPPHEIVRRIQVDKKWSQGRLAGLAGISRQLVGAIESGRRPITADSAIRLGPVLGVPWKRLWTDHKKDVSDATKRIRRALTGGSSNAKQYS